MDADDYPATIAWFSLLEGIYAYEKQGRLRELNGDRPKEWSGDGLHIRSHLWGQLDATRPVWLSDAMAEAPELLAISPSQLRTAAYADATDEFVARLLSYEHPPEVAMRSRARAQPRAQA